MKFQQITFGVLLALAVTAVSAQTVHRWTDANGRIIYSDQPPPVGAKDATEKNMRGNSIQTSEPSVATNEAQKKNPVTLYVSECGDSCDQAKAFLNKRGIPHTVVDPTRSAELNKKFKEETGSSVIPVLKVGDRKLTGWAESNWASALDGAGYPKTASFSKPKPVEDMTGVDSAKKDAPKDAPKEAPKKEAPKANT